MAVKVHLFVDQGATFATTFNLTNEETGAPLDLSSYTASGQIRKHYSSANSVNFTCSFANAVGGVLAITLNSNTSAEMNAGRYVYDVELVETNSNTTSRVVEGILTINPQVTR